MLRIKLWGIGVALGAVLAVGSSAFAMSGCPYTPNYYAGGTDTGTNTYYGVQGYISAHSESVPESNYNFTDEAMHIIASSSSSSADGLEIGWYVGWGSGNGTYVTSPHVYGTFNGPGEIDGPSVSTSSDDYYTAYTDSSKVAHFVLRSSKTGTDLWSNTESYPGTPGGTAVAMGETNSNTLPMGPSTLKGLNHLNGAGQWFLWPGLSPCADSPYSVTSYSNTSVSND